MPAANTEGALGQMWAASRGGHVNWVLKSESQAPGKNDTLARLNCIMSFSPSTPLWVLCYDHLKLFFFNVHWILELFFRGSQQLSLAFLLDYLKQARPIRKFTKFYLYSYYDWICIFELKIFLFIIIIMVLGTLENSVTVEKCCFICIFMF